MVIEELSGSIAKGFISEISRFHRIQASPGFHEAISYVEQQMNQLPGVKTKVSFYPADGSRRTWQWTAPMGWRVNGGELRLIHPHQELITRFSETPVSVVAHSQGVDVKAPLVYVGEGTRESDYQKVDVEGKVVLSSGRARDVHRQAVLRRGALGTVHFPGVERRTHHPDLVQYEGIWPRKDEVRNMGFAFSVSGKTGLRLRRLVEKEKEVLLHAKVDAELYKGEQRVLTAVIEGEKFPEEEILLIAHLCHPRPSANDNASGSALLMEIARTASALISQGYLPQPHRTIRFMWVPEFYGTICYLHEHPELAKRTISAINCDMVGQDSLRCGGSLILYRTPHSLPHYINDLLEYLLEEASKEPGLLSPQGSRQPFRFKVKGFAGGSDHIMLVDSTIGVPCPMLNHWPDAFYHSSQDSVDKCDATQLNRVAFAVALATFIQAYAEKEDTIFIASEVYSRSLRRLSKNSQKIIHDALAAHKGYNMFRALRKGIEQIRRLVRCDELAIKSANQLSRQNQAAQRFTDNLIADLHRVRDVEEKRLQELEKLRCQALKYRPPSRLRLRKPEKAAIHQIPRRTFTGPLSLYTLNQVLPPKEADWLRRQREKPLFTELLLELTNYIDGYRNLFEIQKELEAEFGDIAKIETVTKLAHLLESIGLLTI